MNIEERRKRKHEYYLRHRETMLKKMKEYRQRPEVLANQKTPEAKERRREIKRRYRQRHREQVLEYDRQRYRTKTDYWKNRYLAKREEIRAKQNVYASKPESKAKKSAYTKEYQARPEVFERNLAKSRAWKKTPKGRRSTVYHNERRRAILLGALGSFTKEEWLRLRETTGGVCPICQKYVGVDKMSIDHIIPLSKGGTNYISNIRAICRNCNSAIGNRPYIYLTNEKTGKREKLYC